MTGRYKPSLCVVASLLAVLSAVPAAAQRSVAVEPQALSEGVDVRVLQQPTAGAIDESALRYFAQKGDRAAVEAEIARLKGENPTWQAPDDLFASGQRVDERPLWALYEARDLEGVRASIAALQAKHPEWTPPAKLVELVEAQEVRQRVEAAAAAKDWRGIVATAASHAGQFSCATIDRLWLLGEAQAREGDQAAAEATYRRVIESCPEADLRFATLQKAKALLPADKLAGLAKREAERLDDAEARRRVEALLAPPPARAKPSTPPAFAALYAKGAGIAEARAAEGLAEARRDAAAARKIGWLHHDASDAESAAAWFERSLAWRRSDEAARGLALSLAALERFDALDALALQHPALAGEIAAATRPARIARALEADDFASVLEATLDATTPAELSARGWALLNLERPAEAVVAFTGVAAAPGATPQDAAEAGYGAARAHLATGALREAAVIVAHAPLTPERRAELEADMLGAEAVEAYNAKAYRRALELLTRRHRLVPLDRGLGTIEAWARYNLGQTGLARRIFQDLDRTYSTSETREALAVIAASERRHDG